MKAEEARNLSKESVKDEILQIESKIIDACKGGHTRIQINDISEAAIAYFKDADFIVNEIFLTGTGMVTIIQW